jgi:formiminoglutamase
MMHTSTNLQIFGPETLAHLIHLREAETKIGQDLIFLASDNWTELEANLHLAAVDGARYAILGVPEDIGIRANFGRGGINGAWKEFLRSFVNLQSNQFVDCSRILMLGELTLSDLQNELQSLQATGRVPIHKLRELCAAIDMRLAPIIEQVAAAGLEPIIVGGGSNNSYPILKGTVAALHKGASILPEEGISVVNCDMHAGFRILEGRHAGNSFTYAHADDLLKGYFVVGLQEANNAREMLDRLSAADFKYVTYEQFALRNELSFADALKKAEEYISAIGGPCGLVLDLSAIENMPAVSEMPTGISTEQANRYVYALARSCNTAYLYLSQGTPPIMAEGEQRLGKTLTTLVLSYVKAREAYYS